jgi:predicted NACHT family NTPase
LNKVHAPALFHRVEIEREDTEMRLRRLTRQQLKNRQALLNKVRKFWVEGVLETSLQDQVLIELDLEERADAVVSSWTMELATTDEAQKPLPKGTNVISIFDQLGERRMLLILGEPGAGKTTTLLELTRNFVNRAEQGLDYRIPVVFNLSSWAGRSSRLGIGWWKNSIASIKFLSQLELIGWKNRNFCCCWMA